MHISHFTNPSTHTGMPRISLRTAVITAPRRSPQRREKAVVKADARLAANPNIKGTRKINMIPPKA
jgi:hypothetical protein